ncbi:MAG: hypothetical protein GYA62_00675 [Bacteroidales bacterium]|nr:hypothetical protein [Bacteroidales bacterium]
MNKSIEKEYLEWFINTLNWSNYDIIEFEMPDFIVNYNNKKIGFEITNLYKNDYFKKGSLDKKCESYKASWLISVANEYYKFSKVPILLKVFASSKSNLPDPSLMADIIYNYILNTKSKDSKYIYDLSSDYRLIFYIKKLPSNFEMYNRWIFINNHVDIVGSLDIEYLKSKVDIKRRKTSNYNKNLDKLILLLVIDSSNASGMINIENIDYDFKCNEFSEI